MLARGLVHNRPVSEQLIEIRGGTKLSGGRVSIAGSSNQVTKCIIAALLTDRGINRAPVTDPAGHLLGLVSRGDIVKATMGRKA